MTQHNKIHVRVGKQAFIKERQTLYSNFEQAMARELAQNALDAGADRIDIEIAELDDGLIRLTYTDNGTGMDARTLEEVWFELGATTKEDSSDTGGYGRARLLLCFSMERYTIRTRDCRVEGNGPEADAIETGLPYFRGCQFDIVIPAGTTSIQELVEAFAEHHHLSRYRARVRLNGKPIQLGDGRPHRGKHIRNLRLEGEVRDWASVWANRSANLRNRILVRVNGVLMYETFCRIDALISVELDAERSRSILVASRDRLAMRYNDQLNEFAQELAVEGDNSLKPRFSRKSGTLRLGGMLVNRPLIQSARLASDGPMPDKQKYSTPLMPSGEGFRDSETITPPAVDQGAVDPGAISQSEAVSRYAEASACIETRRLFDIIVIDECDNPRVRKVIADWDPKSWELEQILTSGAGRGRTRLRLLMAWKTACSHTVDALLRTRPDLGDIIWTVGWYFADDDDLAGHYKTGAGHILALRPVDNQGRTRYQLSRREDLNKLVAIARHEVAHIISKWHDASFASLLTHLDGEMNDSEVISDMRRQTL